MTRGAGTPHLLLVAYAFPPLATSGAYRPLRIAKYLPARGWRVTVVSVTPRVRLPKDPALAGDVPDGTRVVRTRTLEPRTPLIALNRLGLGGVTRRLEPWFMVPDDQRGWVPFARAAARRVHAADPVDAVLTTSSPCSAHLVGAALRLLPGVAWVADFRDEWTSNPYLAARYPTRAHVRYNERLERRVLRGADRVVSVSAGCLAGLARLAPARGEAAEGESRLVEIPNGYDGAHFPDAAPPRPERFRVVYTGAFYGRRSPAPFLEAVRRLLAAGTLRPGDLEVVIAGDSPGAGLAGAGAGAGALPDGVRVLPQVPYFESLRLMRDAALLLLVLAEDDPPGIVTGKIFNYLASRRPILALAPDGRAAELVRGCRAGEVVPPGDTGAIAAALARFHALWRDGGIPLDPDLRAIEAYEGSRQAAAWDAVLREAIAAAARGRAARGRA